MNTETRTPTQIYVGDLHHEHMMWLNTLNYRKEEVALLERRMEDIVRRSDEKEVMAELEHFQNQYIREREVIDELSHDIKIHDKLVTQEAKEHPIAVDHRNVVAHKLLKDRMATFEKLSSELRDEFMGWVERWM